MHTRASARIEATAERPLEPMLPRRIRPRQASLFALGVVIALGSSLGACKRKAEPSQQSSSSPLLPSALNSSVATPASPHDGPKTAPSALPMGVTWAEPNGWQRVPLQNPMRKATYRVPRAGSDQEDGELAVFYFGPSEGGSIEANVQRWIKQFPDVQADKVRREDRTRNDLRQHTVEIESGTFSSGMPGGPTQPKAGYALLGGIVESPSGAYFFKLTGPSATVKAAKPAFLGLLDSVKVGS